MLAHRQSEEKMSPALPSNDGKVRFNMQSDLLEHKNSIMPPPAVLVGDAQASPCALKMKALQYYVAQKAWLQELLEGQQMLFGTGAISKAAIMRQMRTNSKMLGDELTCVTKEGAMAPIFAPAFFMFRPGGVWVQMSTDYNLLDVRLCVEGSVTCYAVPLPEVQGDTLAAQHDTLCKMEAKALVKHARQKGFVLTLADKQLAVFPPGYAMVFVNSGTEPMCGVRWALVGSAGNAKAAVELNTSLLMEYGDLQAGAHKPLLDHLKVLAAA
jgi:hypothetical protein